MNRTEKSEVVSTDSPRQLPYNPPVHFIPYHSHDPGLKLGAMSHTHTHIHTHTHTVILFILGSMQQTQTGVFYFLGSTYMIFLLIVCIRRITDIHQCMRVF